MDIKHRVKLKRTLGALGRIVPEYQFLYTASDADSFPGLIIDKKISALDILHLRRRAMSKEFLRGTVKKNQEGRVIFLIESGRHTVVTDFRSHLQGSLKEQLPTLAGAIITVE